MLRFLVNVLLTTITVLTIAALVTGLLIILFSIFLAILF